MKKAVTLFIILLIFPLQSRAASVCSYKEQTEINKKIANIKVSYNIETEEKSSITGLNTKRDYVNIIILNMTEDFYLRITNEIDDTEKIIYYDDTTEGRYNYRWDNLLDVTKFNIEVFTTDMVACPDELFKTLYITTPKYNELHEAYICSEYDDFELCQKYITTTETITTQSFNKKLEKFKIKKEQENVEKPEKEESKSTFYDELIIFLRKYGLIIGGSFLSLLIIIALIKAILKRKRIKDSGL